MSQDLLLQVSSLPSCVNPFGFSPDKLAAGLLEIGNMRDRHFSTVKGAKDGEYKSMFHWNYAAQSGKSSPANSTEQLPVNIVVPVTTSASVEIVPHIASVGTASKFQVSTLFSLQAQTTRSASTVFTEPLVDAQKDQSPMIVLPNAWHVLLPKLKGQPLRKTQFMAPITLMETPPPTILSPQLHILRLEPNIRRSARQPARRPMAADRHSIMAYLAATPPVKLALGARITPGYASDNSAEFQHPFSIPGVRRLCPTVINNSPSLGWWGRYYVTR